MPRVMFRSKKPKRINGKKDMISERELPEKLKKKLSRNLSERRYEHTLGVAYTAACLAMRFGADPLKAEIAGLLHDCAKEFSEKELLKLGEKYGYHFEDYELEAPQVMHAVIGPYIAKDKYGVDDPEILSAIRWHTTGRGDMTLLEKIVFTADYIEPNRFKASNLPEIRTLAFSDLSYCVYRISEDTLSYLRTRGIPVDPMTGECYQWLKENGNHDK